VLRRGRPKTSHSYNANGFINAGNGAEKGCGRGGRGKKRGTLTRKGPERTGCELIGILKKGDLCGGGEEKTEGGSR